MPTTYTHYRFGKDVCNQLSEKTKQLILKYEDLFHYGLHGPDLLFYYNALQKNHVNMLGSRLHRLPGSYFFENAKKELLEKENKEPYYAYLYGFICHFSLDVACHGYIGEITESTSLTHSELEAEVDRRLLVMDGENPVTKKLTGHLHPSRESAEVIQAFYPAISGKEILKAMKDMSFYLNILVAPSKIHRGTLEALLKAAGQYEDKGKLIINYEENPACTAHTDYLLKVYEETISRTAGLIEELAGFVEREEPLDALYNYNFNGQNERKNV